MSGAYRLLAERFARLADLEGALAVLAWDQAVWMPKGGAEARGRQIATLRRLQHELITAPEVGPLLDDARTLASELDPWQQANLREMERLWRMATAVDPALVERAAEATTRAELVWREAREKSDFALLAPHLAVVVDLERERARQLAAALDLAPYDALIALYQPGLRAEAIDRLFAPLERQLPHAIDDALARQPPALRPNGPYPKERQRALALDLLPRLTFDFDHGRLDESAHPFCGGTPTDIRLTTRFDEGDPVSGLMAVLHETGHALYEAGLPRAWLGQPVGEARGIAVHESQSLALEMQLGRSPAFLSFLSRLLRQHLGDDPAFAPDNLVRLCHRVERGAIRVEADELTYPLHVILRYRLEKALIAGELAVDDLPAAWNEGMKELLAIVPPDDRRGVLQDIHWPLGAIGYFPCYTVGALLAAQLTARMRRELPDLDRALAAGECGVAVGWLRERVHAWASFCTFEELVTRATGAPLSPHAFLSHIGERYGVRRALGEVAACTM
ncbi:Thermostable carboxypeptidase 1 [bacterium HR40]|nr:Thermostable carboxypeptidase 1 [bacterium HR40]